MMKLKRVSNFGLVKFETLWAISERVRPIKNIEKPISEIGQLIKKMKNPTSDIGFVLFINKIYP